MSIKNITKQMSEDMDGLPSAQGCLHSDKYADKLKSLGVKKLGEGQSSTVFQHPTHADRVVKVGQICETSNNEGAYVWLDWCKSKHNNKYVPKVFFLKNVGNNYFICTMEKLKPTTFLKLKAFIAESGLTKLFRLRSNGNSWDLNDNIKVTLPDVDLITVLGKLKELYIDYLADLKPDNFMLRGFQVVFTDPVI